MQNYKYHKEETLCIAEFQSPAVPEKQKKNAIFVM
jgi:hypothetical protein